MAQQDRSWISSLAAFGGLAAASLCCLPVLPLALAAGGASAAWFTASKFQPYLLALSAVCIGFGIWQASRARQCSRQRRVLNFALLTIAAVMTAGAIFFPQLIANRLLSPGLSTGSGKHSFVRLMSADQFRDAFNLTPADAVRVVAFYSPT